MSQEGFNKRIAPLIKLYGQGRITLGMFLYQVAIRGELEERKEKREQGVIGRAR